ncbi:hypothetical protein [Sphingobium boeckii]|uniref:TonB-dependent receptor n=1 Tax=Sphingobium boeckii TaxID=1082345 RepID=A0A7W9AIV3_9SPHN|nr:hypothetical protein [Sphingobium boeckii]MBB5686440.1 hypothetical protein [Sphingobium boeckii]
MRDLSRKHPILWRMAQLAPVFSLSVLAGQSAANPDLSARSATARISVQIRSTVRMTPDTARDADLAAPAPAPVERACPKPESERRPGCTMKIVDMP